MLPGQPAARHPQGCWIVEPWPHRSYNPLCSFPFAAMADDATAVSPPVDGAEAVDVRTEPKVDSGKRFSRDSSGSSRDRAIAGAVLLSVLLGFLLLMALTTAMFHAFRHIAVTPEGLLATPSDETLAGVGQAVDHCGLADFPKLSAEDLRRVQDVAFSFNGAFHFYRVASIHQTSGGAVRIEAEDGTRLLVQDDRILFERPWLPKEAASTSSTGLSVPTGVLKIIRPLTAA